MASNDSLATTTQINPIASTLLAWFDQHGRHDLPWQSPRHPYRVWISEIMLQQTQVTTVIPYFERFMQRFDNVVTLANAPIDEVLHLWTGLGYYARARNLHRAAQQIRDQHQGEFPSTFDDIIALPGIGRSTAGAILAQAFEQPYAILDGNVKRVLTRLHAIEGWPGQKTVEQQLWQVAEYHTPEARLADYTQAIMDLGATCCTRSKPQCLICPLQADCQALQQQRQTDFPTRKPKKAIPVRQTQMLVLYSESQTILLEQRPPTGIWGGLWSFPECAPGEDIAQWCQDYLQLQVEHVTPLPTIRHTFSHFHLDITPVRAHASTTGIMDSDKHIWYNTQQPDALGLPAPVKVILDNLHAAEIS